MSPSAKRDLLHTKLEVEADAQKILLKEGGPNVDKAMAQEHLTNIEAKLGELDEAAKSSRVPEWVDHADAPRLFSKDKSNLFYGVPFEASHYIRDRDALIDATKRVREVFSGSPDIEGAAARIENTTTAHLQLSDVQGAIRDIRGFSVINPRTKKVYDHLREVQESIQSLKNQIQVLLKRLNSGSKLSDSETAAINDLVSKASKHADRLEKILETARNPTP